MRSSRCTIGHRQSAGFWNGSLDFPTDDGDRFWLSWSRLFRNLNVVDGDWSINLSPAEVGETSSMMPSPTSNPLRGSSIAGVEGATRAKHFLITSPTTHSTPSKALSTALTTPSLLPFTSAFSECRSRQVSSTANSPVLVFVHRLVGACAWY
jgi:hypothetical protein